MKKDNPSNFNKHAAGTLADSLNTPDAERSFDLFLRHQNLTSAQIAQVFKP